jgi:hypothetical protein
MAFPFAAAIAGASALLGALGGKKKGDAKAKQEQEAAKLKFESDKKRHGQSEKARVAGTKQLASAAGARGINLGELPPEFFEEREFAGAPPGKETGRSGFGEFLSGVGGVGTAAADFMMQKEKEDERKNELDELMCAINPAMCEQAGPFSDEIVGG